MSAAKVCDATVCQHFASITPANRANRCSGPSGFFSAPHSYPVATVAELDAQAQETVHTQHVGPSTGLKAMA